MKFDQIEGLDIEKIPLSELAQAIFEATYLQPFSGAKKENLYVLPVERVVHGAQHVSRVAAFSNLFLEVYRAMGNQEALVLSDRQIKILLLVALLHDAARENEKADLWERESAEMCEKFLRAIGVEANETKQFSALIIEKEKGGLLGKILQSADCLDIIRCKNKFYIEYMSIYQDADDV